ncbi:UNVERIFIED_CONTAM: hypothetical protein Sradi_4352800 [Sesamum radiatum]|uniref:Uncharacterized protein n=1 Tax=Sesamum radiatum TaxID=300843 RepID=A0AAW2NNY9_SESRA
MEDRMNRLETMMVDMIAMMKEMRVSCLTAVLSQPIASSSVPTQPPTDPLTPNDDDMDIADEEGLD